MAIPAAEVPVFQVRMRVTDGGSATLGHTFNVDVPWGLNNVTVPEPDSPLLTRGQWGPWKTFNVTCATFCVAASPNSAAAHMTETTPFLIPLRCRSNLTPLPVVLEAQLIFDETPTVTWSLTGTLDQDTYTGNPDCLALGCVIYRAAGSPVAYTIRQYYQDHYWTPVAGVASVTPPTRFLYATHIYCKDDDVANWTAASAQLRRLGFNTIGATPARGTLTHQGVLAGGMPFFIDGVLTVFPTPRSPLDYSASPDADTLRATFATGQFNSYDGFGMASRLRMQYLQDEPTIWLTTDLTLLQASAPGVARYQAYLQQVSGLTPTDFGQASWAAVLPVGRNEAAVSLANARNYYWTVRFLSQDSSRWLGLVGQSVRSAFGRQNLYTLTNWNNFHGRHIAPGRGGTNTSPNSAIMCECGHDWWDAARGLPALGWPAIGNMLWAEDAYGDGSAYKWSWQGTMLRAAAKAGGIPWGNYLIGFGNATGARRYGWLTQGLLAMAHGSKAFHLFDAGPDWQQSGTGWLDSIPSSNPEITKLQRASELAAAVSACEPITYTAQRVTAKVAIVKPRSSYPWDIQPVAGFQTTLTGGPYSAGATSFTIAGTGVGTSNQVVATAGILNVNPGGGTAETVGDGTAGKLSLAGTTVTLGAPGFVNSHSAGETVQVNYDPGHILRDQTNSDYFAFDSDYNSECFGLCWMMQHAGIIWDWLDEDDVAAGLCAGYSAVYFTEPDAPTATLSALVSYVQGGGTLVTFTQAGTRDRYDQADTTLATAFGFSENARLRTLVQSIAGIGTAGTVLGSAGLPASTVAYGPRATFAGTAGCTIEGTWQSDGSAAVLSKVVGSGRVYHFGWFPGLSYAAGQRIGGALSDSLPAGFDSNLRTWIARPLSLAGIVQQVVPNTALVECNLMTGPAGSAIVVHNWTGADIPGFSLTCTGIAPPNAASLARLGAVTWTYAASTLTASFSLGAADVLLLPVTPAPVLRAEARLKLTLPLQLPLAVQGQPFRWTGGAAKAETVTVAAGAYTPLSVPSGAKLVVIVGAAAGMSLAGGAADTGIALSARVPAMLPLGDSPTLGIVNTGAAGSVQVIWT